MRSAARLKILPFLLAITAVTAVAADALAQARRPPGAIGNGAAVRAGNGAAVRAGNGAAVRARAAAVRPRQAFNSSGIESRQYLFDETGEELEYFVYVSNKVDEDEPSPLVIALHGMGVPPQMMLSQVRDEAQRHGFIVAAPMGYNVRGGYGAYPRGLGNPPDPKVNDWSEQDVLNVLALMCEEFMIDERRIYVLGQSMGGAGALHLGTKYPELWAAVGATAPAVSADEPAGLENARDLPFILVHGDSDPGVPVERSRLWAQRMNELGINYEFYEVRRGGHSDALFSGVRYVFDFFDEHARPAAED